MEMAAKMKFRARMHWQDTSVLYSRDQVNSLSTVMSSPIEKLFSAYSQEIEGHCKDLCIFNL
jgi:hypothetical protein